MRFLQKRFTARIGNVKNGHTKPCGCQLLLASIRTIQIEYDGIQHFFYKEDCKSSWNTKENFLAGKIEIILKIPTAGITKIHLIRISCTDKEKIVPDYLFNLLDNLSLSDYNYKAEE